MIEIRARLPIRPHAEYGVKARDQLRLSFDRRRKSRQRATLASGEEVAIELPRGQVLRGGDWVIASDGRAIEVVAQPERVLHIECESAQALARAAYHLGNRHVPMQVGDGWLRIEDDHVLARMLEVLGARVTALEAPFEPEAGAYGGHSHHHDHESTHGGRIHDFASPSRAPQDDDFASSPRVPQDGDSASSPRAPQGGDSASSPRAPQDGDFASSPRAPQGGDGPGPKSR